MKRSFRGIVVLTSCALLAIGSASAQGTGPGAAAGGTAGATAAQIVKTEPVVEKARSEPARGPAFSHAQLRVFPVGSGVADSLAKIVRELAVALNGPVLALPYSRANLLVVAAETPETMAAIAQLVEELSGPATRTSELPSYQEVPLQHVSLPQAVLALDRLFGKEPALRIVADERTNAVWVAGDPAAVAQGQRLMRSMDESAASAAEHKRAEGRELRFFELKHADAVHLANTVRAIAQAMSLDLKIVPDPMAGILVAHASPGEHALLETVVAKLDVPARHPDRPAPSDEQPARPTDRPVRPGQSRVRPPAQPGDGG